MIDLALMNWLYMDYPDNTEYTLQYLIKAMCGQRLQITSYEVMKRSSDCAVLTWYSWTILPMELSETFTHQIPLTQRKPQYPPLLTKSRAKLHVMKARKTKNQTIRTKAQHHTWQEIENLKRIKTGDLWHICTSKNTKKQQTNNRLPSPQ